MRSCNVSGSGKRGSVLFDVAGCRLPVAGDGVGSSVASVES